MTEEDLMALYKEQERMNAEFAREKVERYRESMNEVANLLGKPPMSDDAFHGLEAVVGMELPRLTFEEFKAKLEGALMIPNEYFDPPYHVVEMPVNAEGNGPEMDPTKVAHTHYELWTATNVNLGTFDRRDVAEWVAGILNSTFLGN